ncbi:MAG: efflux RND transporter periplasmic adaptor subunit [bacterium]
MMKKKVVIALIILIIIIAGYFAFKEFFHKNSNNSRKPSLIAPVTVTKAAYGKLKKKIIIYGKIITDTNGIKNIILSFDSVIDNIYVIRGQNVSKGQLLLDISPTKYAKMRLQQAKNTLKTAKKNLYFIKQRYDIKISTKQDLLSARNAYRNALIQYSTLKKSLASGVFSPISGVINKMFYIKGSSVPAQNPIIQIINKNGLIIRCGIETERLKYIRPGLIARIFVIGGGKKQILGKIIKIAGMANINTHLVNIYIKPVNAKIPLLLGNFVKATIYTNGKKGILVPEHAVLQEDGKYFIYIIKNNIAHKHYVSILLKTDKYDLIKGNVKKGDLAVSTGNYELKPGMKVIIKQIK